MRFHFGLIEVNAPRWCRHTRSNIVLVTLLSAVYTHHNLYKSTKEFCGSSIKVLYSPHTIRTTNITTTPCTTAHTNHHQLNVYIFVTHIQFSLSPYTYIVYLDVYNEPETPSVSFYVWLISIPLTSVPTIILWNMAAAYIFMCKVNRTTWSGYYETVCWRCGASVLDFPRQKLVHT